MGNKYKKALREELIDLWTDFEHSIRRSQVVLPKLSMESEWILVRLERITNLVGPTSWKKISIPFLPVYAAAHVLWDVEIKPIDWDFCKRANAGAYKPYVEQTFIFPETTLRWSKGE